MVERRENPQREYDTYTILTASGSVDALQLQHDLHSWKFTNQTVSHTSSKHPTTQYSSTQMGLSNVMMFVIQLPSVSTAPQQQDIGIGDDVMAWLGQKGVILWGGGILSFIIKET